MERNELLGTIRQMETKPNKQVVAETVDGELIELGPDPVLHVAELEKDPRYD